MNKKRTLKRLAKLTAIVRKEWAENRVVSIASCGNNEVHLAEEAFRKFFEGEQYSINYNYSEKHNYASIEKYGVTFFALFDKPKQTPDLKEALKTFDNNMNELQGQLDDFREAIHEERS